MLMAGLAVTSPCPMLPMPWVLHDPHEAVTNLLFWSEGSKWVREAGERSSGPSGAAVIEPPPPRDPSEAAIWLHLCAAVVRARCRGCCHDPHEAVTNLLVWCEGNK